MRLQDLIEQLQEIHRQYGNLDVFTEDNEAHFNPVNGVGVDESSDALTVSIYVD